jgi:hypothetical protein
VSLEPEFDEAGDAVEVLCGDSLSAATKTAWTLKFTGIQDFSDPKGFVNFAYDHDGESQPFTWKASEDGPSWAGVVNVRALVIGGDVGTRITSDAEWPCNGKPVRTDPPKSDAAPGKRS